MILELRLSNIFSSHVQVRWIGRFAKQVFRFFCDDVVLDYQTPTKLSIADMIIEQKDVLLDILRTADSDIIDIRVESGFLKTYHRSNPDVAFDFEIEE